MISFLPETQMQQLLMTYSLNASLVRAIDFDAGEMAFYDGSALMLLLESFHSL